MMHQLTTRSAFLTSILLLSGLLLSGCAQLAKQAETIKPTAKLVGTRLAGIDFDKVDLVFDLAVENKNPVALKLAGLEYDVKIENQSLVSGVTAKGIKIKANSTSAVALPVTLKFADLKKLPGEIWGKDRLAYQLDTKFNLKLPVIGNYAIPVSTSGELPVPKLPGIKLSDVKIKKMNLTSAELVAQVEVSNPNDFKLALNQFDYALKINQQNWGQGNITRKSTIPRKGTGIIEIPVKLNLLNIGSAAYSLLQKRAPLQYELKGNAMLDTDLDLLKNIKLPVDIKGSTSLK